MHCANITTCNALPNEVEINLSVFDALMLDRIEDMYTSLMLLQYTKEAWRGGDAAQVGVGVAR